MSEGKNGFDAFRAGIERSRQYTREVEGAKFEIKLPSDYSVRYAYESTKGVEVAASRSIIEASVVGWNGVTEQHFDPACEEKPVAFSAEALRLLLDQRQDLADQLTIEVFTLRRDRIRQTEEARKNLGRESSGS